MGNTTKSNVKNKPRDLTIVKVGAAFVMMVLSMLAVQRVLEIYAVMNTFDAVYRASQNCWKLCAISSFPPRSAAMPISFLPASLFP